MPGKAITVGLPRRVVVCYLLFCLTSVVWLGAGAVVTSWRVLQSQTESAALSLVGRVGAATSLAYIRKGKTGLQEVVTRYGSGEFVSSCSVISPTGRYIAHSRPERVGRLAPITGGERLQWGDVEGLRYVASDSSRTRQFRVPITVRGGTIGSLQLELRQPSLWMVGLEAARSAPLAVLAPLLCIGIGAFYLRRLVSPLSGIETQLKSLARQDTDPSHILQRVSARGAASVGWNRLVEAMAVAAQDNDLESRLADVVNARRGGRVEQALQNLNEGIAHTDVEGKILFANRAIAALLQDEVGEAETLVGLSLDALLAREDDELSETFREPGSRHRSVVAEIERETPLGKRIIRTSRCPVRSGDDVAEYVWTLRDVTQQKLADEMRDQFLDAATHELRTPLSNIKAYAETLALSEMNDVERQKEFCNIINSEASRLARFIDDLLDLSSLESGALSVSLQLVETDRLLRDVVEKVRPLTESKQITFEVKLSDKLPEAKLDKDKISATLVNVLGNAVKYTPAGGRVTLRASLTGEALQIEIEDTGVGISEEELGRVFERFFRSSDPRVQEETGSGLGLSLAQEVVQLHGGQMSVESELDKGTKFTISLPGCGES